MASQVLGVFMLKLPCFASVSNPNYHQTLKRSKVPFFFCWLFLEKSNPFSSHFLTFLYVQGNGKLCDDCCLKTIA